MTKMQVGRIAITAAVARALLGDIFVLIAQPPCCAIAFDLSID